MEEMGVQGREVEMQEDGEGPQYLLTFRAMLSLD